MTAKADSRTITRVALRNYKSIAACDVVAGSVDGPRRPERCRQEQLRGRAAGSPPRPCASPWTTHCASAAGSTRSGGGRAVIRITSAFRLDFQLPASDRLVRIRGRRATEGSATWCGRRTCVVQRGAMRTCSGSFRVENGRIAASTFRTSACAPVAIGCISCKWRDIRRFGRCTTPWPGWASTTSIPSKFGSSSHRTPAISSSRMAATLPASWRT